jgi:hypothetical protein
MRVKLVDVDLKYRSTSSRGDPFPNLALTKICRDEKLKGNIVGFDIEDPDKTYVSCAFTKNRLNAIWEVLNIEGDRDFGGSGIWLEKKLPPFIDLLKPDYDLYPFQSFSFGFTSRGCIRKCDFCIVHEKEGRFRRVQHIKEFHDFRFKICKLLDNNILADKEWFFENTNWAIDNKVKLDITQGMDIRLLTPEIAEQLKRIKFVDQQMKFAWDKIEMEPVVKAGIEMLKDAGINTWRNVKFYVLSGRPGVPFCKDAYRCSKLNQWGAMAYVMPWEGGSPMVRALARWANQTVLQKKGPFWQYDRMPKNNGD